MSDLCFTDSYHFKEPEPIPTCSLCNTQHIKFTYVFGMYKLSFCPIVLAQKLSELVPEAIIKEEGENVRL